MNAQTNTQRKMDMAEKLVYSFAGGASDGNGTMRNLLGGKGANLAEMCSLGLPVPPGFTITTEVCVNYYDNGKNLPTTLKDQVADALIKVEKDVGAKFGDGENPLLLSVRSGARASRPSIVTGKQIGRASCRERV